MAEKREVRWSFGEGVVEESGVLGLRALEGGFRRYRSREKVVTSILRKCQIQLCSSGEDCTPRFEREDAWVRCRRVRCLAEFAGRCLDEVGEYPYRKTW